MFNHTNNLNEEIGSIPINWVEVKIYIKQIRDNETLYGEGDFTLWANIEFSEEYILGMDEKEIEQEIRRIFHERCGCDYDCCGHWFGWGVPLQRLGKRTWAVMANYAQNY